MGILKEEAPKANEMGYDSRNDSGIDDEPGTPPIGIVTIPMTPPEWRIPQPLLIKDPDVPIRLQDGAVYYPIKAQASSTLERRVRQPLLIKRPEENHEIPDGSSDSSDE